MSPKEFVVRCRGVIIDQGEMLVVSHHGADYLALPGGKLDFGEDPISCMKRELIEELGIKPDIGRLLYVNSFSGDIHHTVEFIFEILNSAEYRDYEKYERTHAFELAGLEWIKPENSKELLPKEIVEDFKDGSLFSDTPKFIYN